MRVMTSQCVTSGKITFAQLKLSPPRHNLLAMQTQTNNIYIKQALLL